ncbi:flagellar hook-length control protein FliK [Shewanella halifaxensis]|uniref:flagellar hook-length control protein FliK n=1 Tax=Shewanella halifaxensis TaxID=271098 RepID=UPI001F17B440|nr:flagellar hook-length control protein FliK [Shewanella halifaxensis]
MISSSVLSSSTPSNTTTGGTSVSNPVTDTHCHSCIEALEQHQTDVMPFSMAFSLVNIPAASQHSANNVQLSSTVLPLTSASSATNPLVNKALPETVLAGKALSNTQLSSSALEHTSSSANQLTLATSFAAGNYGQPLQSTQAQAQPHLSTDQVAMGQTLAPAGSSVAIKTMQPPSNQHLGTQNTTQAVNSSRAMNHLGSQLNSVTSQTSFAPPTAMVKSDTMMGQNLFQGVMNTPLPTAISDSTAVDIVDSVNQILASNTRTQTAVTQWGPVSVSQTAPLMQQAHEMLSPLREQLKFQIDQQIKQAEIRLDPPELGKVELNVRLDGDRLHIQMHAANASVRDALLTGLDRLRAELAMDHGGQIDVDISQDDRKQKQDPSAADFSIAASTVNENQATFSNKEQQTDHVDLLA